MSKQGHFKCTNQPPSVLATWCVTCIKQWLIRPLTPAVWGLINHRVSVDQSSVSMHQTMNMKQAASRKVNSELHFKIDSSCPMSKDVRPSVIFLSQVECGCLQNSSVVSEYLVCVCLPNCTYHVSYTVV